MTTRKLPEILVGYGGATRRLIEAMDRHFVRLMRNWARAGAGLSGGGGGSLTSNYSGFISGGYRESTMPVMNGEASDVSRALETLRLRERTAVKLFWSYEGRELEWLARRLCCDYRTVEARLKKGHDLLRAEMERYRAEQQACAAENRRIGEAISSGIIDDAAYAQPFSREPVDSKKLQV